MENSAREVKESTCRACTAFCPVQVEIEDGRTIALKPVKDHPVYHGYACARGRASPEFAYLKGRLLHSVKRQPDGTHRPIESAQAMREVAEIIQRTIERHGPRSVALYQGTTGQLNLPATILGGAFMNAIGSPMAFSSLQIDQPGKPIAAAMHGSWLAGHADLDEADAWLVIGTNPAISMMFPPNPAHVISRAKKRGAQIYVIDPRRTEIAQHADIFLQAQPGQDAVILAGLIHIVLAEKLHDAAFLTDNARGLDALAEAVEKFTPDFVARRAGVPVEQLQAMARGFAASKRGVAFAGTGPNMSPHGTLMEYLRLCLMTLCGHWRREGDAVLANGMLINLPPPIAQAVDPSPAWGLGQQLRVRNLTNTASGMPTSALAEEILLEGEGRVRILIVNGGNPMAAWPDQLRTQEAMKKLDLLVCLDPVMSDTAKHAHYVIAPKVQFETTHTTAVLELGGIILPVYRIMEPYAAYSPPLVEPPPGSDVVDDWEFFYDVARHMGMALSLQPTSFIFDPAGAEKRTVQLDMSKKPTTETMWAHVLADSPVSLAELKANPSGKLFDIPQINVLPQAPDWTGRLDVGNVDMMQDMQRAYDGLPQSETKGFSHKLISRRLKDRFNGCWREHPVVTRQWQYNPAFMNPDDMSSLGLAEGDLVEIRSRRGAIKGVVMAEKTLLSGVVSMSHSWGANPDEDADPLLVGANTGLLTDSTADCDPYSAMPRMSSIPVGIKLVEQRRLGSTSP